MGTSLDPLAIGELIDDAMRPGNLFVAAELRLSWVAAKAETIRWEVFRGRLVDASQTREMRSFLSWHVFEESAGIPSPPTPLPEGEGRNAPSPPAPLPGGEGRNAPSPPAPLPGGEGGNVEPIISVKFDVVERRIHVVRGILAYVWEGHGEGIIESRETIRWTRELVGTIALDEYGSFEPVREELKCLIWQAVVGTSRLPLTSVEAPLPGFSFGKLHYGYRKGGQETPMRSWAELVACFDEPGLAEPESVKLMEFALRGLHPGDLLGFLESCRNKRILSLPAWREMFNAVSLSPDTPFVERAMMALTLWASPIERIDFCAHLLNQLHRHLTAYDLVTFHHRGANYPDALLLDRVLQDYVYLTGCEEFGARAQASKRKRCRALRQACLMRRHYEGHMVPDLPTSPGENARVLPASHPRVPEEQLTQSVRRRRRLYADEPLAKLLTPCARAVLAQSISDLEERDERVEMGLGLFIDRPLGYGKAIGEPDQTPLLAHEAFSPSLARRRWRELKTLCRELDVEFDEATLDARFAENDWPAGLPHSALAECPRLTAALADMRRVAEDFVILRTLPRGLRGLLGLMDWRPLLERFPLRFLEESRVRLCVQVLGSKEVVLALYDQELQRRVELEVDESQGYRTRGGVEWPAAGLRVLAVAADDDTARRIEVADLFLPPRVG